MVHPDPTGNGQPQDDEYDEQLDIEYGAQLFRDGVAYRHLFTEAQRKGWNQAWAYAELQKDWHMQMAMSDASPVVDRPLVYEPDGNVLFLRRR